MRKGMDTEEGTNEAARADMPGNLMVGFACACYPGLERAMRAEWGRSSAGLVKSLPPPPRSPSMLWASREGVLPSSIFVNFASVSKRKLLIKRKIWVSETPPNCKIITYCGQKKRMSQQSRGVAQFACRFLSSSSNILLFLPLSCASFSIICYGGMSWKSRPGAP